MQSSSLWCTLHELTAVRLQKEAQLGAGNGPGVGTLQFQESGQGSLRHSAYVASFSKQVKPAEAQHLLLKQLSQSFPQDGGEGAGVGPPGLGGTGGAGVGPTPHSAGCIERAELSGHIPRPPSPSTGQIMFSAVACPAQVVPPAPDVQPIHSQKPKLVQVGVKVTTLEPTTLLSARQHAFSMFQKW